MPPTTSTTSTHRSEPRPARLAVVARNAAESRPARLVGVFDDPAHRDGRRIAVVATPRAPFVICLGVLRGDRPVPPDDGPGAPALGARRAA